MADDDGFTFHEFFCGGGMAQVGLGAHWRCLLANDIDPKKTAAYRANFPDAPLIEGDVAALRPADAPPETVDLAWASFPCQDLSVAGPGGGLAASRSGAFWPFWRFIRGLRAEGRAPRLVVIENVCGLITSRGGRDIAALADTLARDGYRLGAFVIDAARFVPQSRPRLFLVASEALPPPDLLRATDDLSWEALRLSEVAKAFSGSGRSAWTPWALPAPETATPPLESVLEPEAAARFDSAEATARLLALMGPRHAEKLRAAQATAKATGRPVAGAAFRRTRSDGSRVEARFDGIAGCLRTPAGGSSRQILILATPDGAVRTRRFTGREGARLMGLPDSYRLPARDNEALKLVGDGVAPPAVRHLAAHLLEPLARAARAEARAAAA